MRCAPTHVDPRARLLSRMRKTIFGIQAASYTRGETLERRNYTHARARMWACVRAGTRTRPAFDCILRIYSGRRVYARRTRFAFSFFFFSSFLFLFSLFSLFPFRTHAARIRTRYRANSTTRLNVYRLINAEWYTRNLLILEFMPWGGMPPFSAWTNEIPLKRGANKRKCVKIQNALRDNVDWTCLRGEIYATKFALQWSLSALSSGFIQCYGLIVMIFYRDIRQ